MLLVIMTKSLIGLDNTVRASFDIWLNGHDKAKTSNNIHN